MQYKNRFFSKLAHNVQHICELPPLYEVERGLGVSMYETKEIPDQEDVY
jgi:hypothetical protein